MLIDVIHLHAVKQEFFQVKESCRGPEGHGSTVSAAGLQSQVWFWAARQAIAPAGIPSGNGSTAAAASPAPGVAVPPQPPASARPKGRPRLSTPVCP